MTMADQVEVTQRPSFHFKRYVNGVEMAEDISIERESTLADAMRRAAERCPKRPGTVLVYCEADNEAAVQKARADALEDASPVWRPIAELADIYQQPIWIASPSLIHGDANPLGIAEAYWQDTDGPEQGEWRTTEFDMCNDEWNTITLPKGAVTHFLIPVGPWSPDELECLEGSLTEQEVSHV